MVVCLSSPTIASAERTAARFTTDDLAPLYGLGNVAIVNWPIGKEGDSSKNGHVEKWKMHYEAYSRLRDHRDGLLLRLIFPIYFFLHRRPPHQQLAISSSPVWHPLQQRGRPVSQQSFCPAILTTLVASITPTCKTHTDNL